MTDFCRAIGEQSQLPMAAVEGDDHLLCYANPAFCRLLDQPKDQIIGKPFCELLPAKDECIALMDRVFHTGITESHKEREHGKPHSLFWSYSVWWVMEDERPVGVMIQVTETVRFHETTLAMNEALILGVLRQGRS